MRRLQLKLRYHRQTIARFMQQLQFHIILILVAVMITLLQSFRQLRYVGDASGFYIGT